MCRKYCISVIRFNIILPSTPRDTIRWTRKNLKLIQRFGACYLWPSSCVGAHFTLSLLLLLGNLKWRRRSRTTITNHRCTGVWTFSPHCRHYANTLVPGYNIVLFFSSMVTINCKILILIMNYCLVQRVIVLLITIHTGNIISSNLLIGLG